MTQTIFNDKKRKSEIVETSYNVGDVFRVTDCWGEYIVVLVRVAYNQVQAIDISDGWNRWTDDVVDVENDMAINEEELDKILGGKDVYTSRIKLSKITIMVDD